MTSDVSAVDFLPYGLNNGDSALSKEDDAFRELRISTDFSFFGKSFNKVYVSTNGVIFFGEGKTDFTPTPFPMNGTRAVAAYWTDSDPREGGNIFYRETYDSKVLEKISLKVRQGFVQFGNFRSNWALITTFNNVPAFACIDCSKVVNHQTVLTTNGIQSFVLFFYDKLEYGSAQTGFNAGDGKRFYVTAASKRQDSGDYVLNNSNVNVPGEWIFSIGEKICGACNDYGFLEVFPKKILYIGNQEVYFSGPCFVPSAKTIEVQFGDEFKTCDVINGTRIRCLAPFFDSIGKVVIKMSYKNINYTSFVLVYDEIDEFYANLTSLDIPFDKFGIYFENDSLAVQARGSVQVIYLNKRNEIEKNNIYSIHENINNKISDFKKIIKKIKTSSIGLRDSVIINVLLIKEKELKIQMVLGKAGSQNCRDWYKREPPNKDIQDIAEREAKLNPCPPRAPSHLPYQLPGGFVKSYIHEKSKACYRSTNNPRGISTECCYNTNNVLILGYPGGGSLNMADSFVSKTTHLVKDVYPYLVCCLLSNDCDKYYEKRPSTTSKFFVPPSPPVTVAGDPHFRTLDGLTYVFNPIGEFIYLKEPETQIQCRISQFENVKASYIKAFALKTEGEETIQVVLDSRKNLTVTIGSSTVKPDIYSFDRVTINFEDLSKVSITTRSGVALYIYAIGGILNMVSVLDPRLKGQVHGLVGNWDDDVNNDLMLPNNTFISVNSTSQEIHYNFGLFWSTTKNTTLFTYPGGYEWEDFQDASFVPFFGIPPPDSRCQDNKECLFDLFLTNDTEIARANLVIDEIRRNKKDDIREMSSGVVTSDECSKSTAAPTFNLFNNLRAWLVTLQVTLRLLIL